jgi:alginate O-acetyltransferase complex protein AlgJ
MKHILKYLVLFAFLGCISFVLFEQYADNNYLLFALCAVVTLAGFYVIRKHIESWKFHKFFLVFSFLFLIFIPFIGQKESESFEKRRLAEFPHLRLSNVWKFLFEYENYFNDRFAFRNSSVQAISKFRFRLFRISPMPVIVEVGKYDWLYTSRPDYIEETSTPFTPAQLDSVILNLKIITKYFDIRNIKYYFAMIPVKERIYPEYMPPALLYRMRFSKAEQLHAELVKHPDIRAIDVKDELIKGKKLRPTYYSADTHWNEYGAFLGYRKIIERVRADFPQVVPFELSDFEVDSVITDAGDLQLLMGFRDELHYIRYHLKNRNPVEPVIIDSTLFESTNSRYSIREMPAPVNGLRLFLVRDSFSQYMRYFITPNFDRTVLGWQPVVPVAKVMQEKPDIVIHEILEHFVMFTLQLPPEIAGDTLFLNQYFPGYLRK